MSFNISQALVFCTDTHVCTISKVIGINEEKEICLPGTEYIISHRSEIITMVVKYLVHIHVTTDLKAYWLLVHNNANKISVICRRDLNLLYTGVSM